MLFFFFTPSSTSYIFFPVSVRGPPDISSLVPVGPKYTMKWSAPLQHVQVVEVGQEGSQNKDTLFQQSGNKRPSSICTSGKTQTKQPVRSPSTPSLSALNESNHSGWFLVSDAARLISVCSRVSRGGPEMHQRCLSL